MDGSGIHCEFNENLQQAIDCMSPTHVVAMIKLVSPQLAAASYVGALITLTDVAMHATADNDSDNEETDGPYAACCDDDLDHLSNDELQALVHTLLEQHQNQQVLRQRFDPMSQRQALLYLSVLFCRTPSVRSVYDIGACPFSRSIKHSGEPSLLQDTWLEIIQ